MSSNETKMMILLGTPDIIRNRVPDRKKANENERSPSVALLCAGLLRGGTVCELERVLCVCDGFFCNMTVTYDGVVLLWQW